MKRRLFVFGVTAGLITTLVSGCGSGGAKPADVQRSQSATADSGITIKFGIHVADPAAQEAVTNEIVEAFNDKYKGQYKVEFEAAEKSAHSTNLKLKATDGTLPELFWVDAAEAPDYVEAGVLLDLTGFLGEYETVNKALDDSTKAAFLSEGIQYGLPYQSNVEGFFYNKAVFAEHGIPLPEHGTTYEELLDMIAGLNEAGVTPIAQGSTDTYAIWAFLAVLDRYGYSDYIGDILAGNEKFNNPDLRSCFEKLKALGEVSAFPDNMSTLSYFDAKEQFKAGNTAMFNTGAWDCSELDEAIGENIGFWWGPVFGDSAYNQKRAMKVPSAPICVSGAVVKNEKVKECVYKFLEFYYSEEAAKITYAGSAFPSTNFTGVAVSEEQYALKAVLNALDEGWESPSAQPDLVISSSVQAQLYDSMLGVMLGNYEPEEALEKIDKQQAYVN